MYDVVVVGAGPAGSTAAKFLSEESLKVLLIDKDKFPREKPCGGGLPSRVLNRFEYIKDEGLIDSYSFGGVVHSSNMEYKIEIEKDEHIVAMVLRKKFDFGLVKLAVDSGAILKDGTEVKDIKISKDKVKIFLDDGTSVDSEIVIGADGIWSAVAKKSGLSQKHKNAGMCIFQEYHVGKETLDKYFSKKRHCHIHIKLFGTPGYGWVFPKNEHLNIGIGEIKPMSNKLKGKTNLKEVFRNYMGILKENNIIPNNLKIGKIQGGALPISLLEKTYSDRVILCGDAGGFINPVSGEGIYYAMASGEIAAKVIVDALKSGDASERFLSRYQKIWKKDFGKDIKLFSRSAKRLTKTDNNKFFKLVSRDEKLTDMVLSVIHGGVSIHEYRWKLIRRYFYVYFKEMLSK
jgi:geranylgeranyl reductase family protein